MAYVYAFIDLKVEKMRWVGKGTNDRDTKHLVSCHRETSPAYSSAWYGYLRNMIRDGIEFIIVRLLDNVSDEEAYAYEKETIKRVGRKIDGTGPLLNMSEGGEGGMSGVKLSEETKKKMSKSRVGNKNPQYGNPRSEETKRKISKSLTGKKHSQEAKDKMSKSQKNRKPPSQETRDKMSAWQVGKKVSQETKDKMGVAQRARRQQEQILYENSL